MQKTPYILRKKIAFCLLGVLLFSCGYQSPYSLSHSSQSLSIPYIEKDESGQLTSFIVEEMAKSALYPMRLKSGRLKLFVELMDLEEEDIGFRYAKEPDGTQSNRLVVSEKRLLLTAIVKLVDSQEESTLLGPTKITTSFTYDFDPDISDDRVTMLPMGDVPTIRFSLGQLESDQSAQRAAFSALYRTLAKRIADYVICNHLEVHENRS
jgi:hypothetical protein